MQGIHQNTLTLHDNSIQLQIQCISCIVFFLLRLSVAALHFNENSGRQQATSKSGELQYGISYPKAKKGLEAVVKPKKTPPTFSM